MIDLLLYLDGLGVGLVRGDDLKELLATSLMP